MKPSIRNSVCEARSLRASSPSVFIGSKLIGGQAALGPLSGIGCDPLSQARLLDDVRVEVLDGDVSLSGRVCGRVW